MLQMDLVVTRNPTRPDPVPPTTNRIAIRDRIGVGMDAVKGGADMGGMVAVDTVCMDAGMDMDAGTEVDMAVGATAAERVMDTVMGLDIADMVTEVMDAAITSIHLAVTVESVSV